jgi:hypothetical protein
VLGLWYLRSLSTIFQLYCGGNREFPEKITDLPQVTDNGFIRGVAFGGSDYKKGGLWWEWLYKGRLLYMYISYKYYQVISHKEL